MANPQSSVRFDHREIAVIFSLFIFVSLLMFTVGILVGKGLAQARFEGTAQIENNEHGEHTADRMPTAEEKIAHPNQASLGSSIMTEHHEAKLETSHGKPEHEGAVEKENSLEKPELHAKHSSELATPHHSAVEEEDKAEKAEPKTDLELVPAHPKHQLQAGLTNLPKSKETENILKNSKIKGIFEEDENAQRRDIASVHSKIPASFPQGKFTVQVGSYPTQKDALDRVEALKKLGFPYAYFSAKELVDNKGTWFRVSLGFFLNEEAAKLSGKILEARGEVKNYLVRKTETEG